MCIKTMKPRLHKPVKFAAIKIIHERELLSLKTEIQ